MYDTISIIMTTFNRVENTLKCINCLINCDLPDNTNLKIFIADSNSPDNTIKTIKNRFPFIEIFNIGNNIFWNQGMRLAWMEAAKYNTKFYLLLNDDTFLKKDALHILLNDFKSLKNHSIIVGATDYNGNLTYGGRSEKYNSSLIKPNGLPQKIKYMNGNCVLVSRTIFEKLGNLNDRYSHSLGDIDYGLRAIKNNIEVYISSSIIGTCAPNSFMWYNPEFSLYTRFKLLFSPKGLPIKEYIYFNYTYFGILKVFKFLISISIALFLPRIFVKINNK